MSLRTRLRFAIVTLAAIVVIGLATLYLWDFTRLAFDGAHSRALILGREVRDYVAERVTENLREQNRRPNSPEEFRQAATEIIRADHHIANKLVESITKYDAVLNIEIVSHDAVLANSVPSSGPEVPTYNFETLSHRNAFLNLFDLFFRRADYATNVELSVVGATPQQDAPAFSVRVIIQSLLLSKVLEPAFFRLMAGFFVSLAAAMFLAALLPNLVLTPLERVSRRIESIGEEAEPAPPARGEAREFVALQSKLSILGQRFRGARQDAQEMRRNFERMLQRLEEGVLLFDSTGRLMMAGDSVERLIGQTPQSLAGQTADQIFAGASAAPIAGAVHARQSLHDQLIVIPVAGEEIRTLVSVEPLEDSRRGNVGTLITLRDAETRSQIEAQIDFTARLAAVSRLTSGVAHEIKNPLNAISLHLEVLRARLEDAEPEASVILREIRRLDHVVKTFLNFSKPLELKLQALDLNDLVREAATLIAPEAESKGIVLETQLCDSARVGGDHDLIKQAVLDIVINAIEAMKDNGTLRIRTEVAGGESVVTIADTGPGIPSEARDKVFNLFYSTKEQGSGIGLAMAFRVVQMHGGTIDFVSETGQGASFSLRFPHLRAHGDDPLSRAARVGK